MTRSKKKAKNSNEPLIWDSEGKKIQPKEIIGVDDSSDTEELH